MPQTTREGQRAGNGHRGRPVRMRTFV